MTNRGRVGVLAAALALVVGVAAPARAATTPWTVSFRPAPGAGGSPVHLEDVTATASHAYAVGHVFGDGVEHPVVDEDDGAGWTARTAPAAPDGSVDGAQLWSVTAGHGQLWVVGSASFGPQAVVGEFVAQRTPAGWREHVFGGDRFVTHVAVLGAGDVWVLGRRFTDAGFRGFSAHFDGRSWTTTTLPVVPDFTYYHDVTPAWSPAHTRTGAPVLLRLGGDGWQVTAGPHVPSLPAGDASYGYTDVVAQSGGRLLVTVGYTDVHGGVGAGLGLWRRTDSGGWTRLLQLAQDAPSGAVLGGDGGLWLVSSGLRAHQDLLHVVDGRLARRVHAAEFGTTGYRITALARTGSNRYLTVGDLVRADGSTAAAVIDFRPAG